MIEYQIVQGTASEVEDQVETYLNQGWMLHGDLIYNVTEENFAQGLTKSHSGNIGSLFFLGL